jgi:hypothetical protein
MREHLEGSGVEQRKQTPPLPCTQCQDLFPMDILTWDGSFCGCRTECDAERAHATVRCKNCGTTHSVYFADEGSLLALDEWFGGEDPCRWHVQVWGGSTDGMSISLPDDEVTPHNQWLEDIENQLEKGEYVFRSPRGNQ